MCNEKSDDQHDKKQPNEEDLSGELLPDDEVSDEPSENPSEDVEEDALSADEVHEEYPGDEGLVAIDLLPETVVYKTSDFEGPVCEVLLEEELATEEIAPSISVASASTEDDSKKKTDVKPSQFEVDGLDSSGEKVEKIYSQLPDYVVYRTKSGIYIEVDHDLEDYRKYYNLNARILRFTSQVTTLLPAELNTCEEMCSQVARAVVTNLRGRTKEAIAMLHEADYRIRRRKVIRGRLQYSASSLALVTVVLLLGYLNYLLWPAARVGISYWDIVSCGALGGLLSVAIGYPRLAIDVDADSVTNCLIGASRILIAMVAAVFVFFLIKSGLALGPVEDIQGPFGVYTFAMVSGFSERFVPNLLDNLTSGSVDQADTPEVENKSVFSEPIMTPATEEQALPEATV